MNALWSFQLTNFLATASESSPLAMSHSHYLRLPVPVSRFSELNALSKSRNLKPQLRIKVAVFCSCKVCAANKRTTIILIMLLILLIILLVLLLIICLFIM